MGIPKKLKALLDAVSSFVLEREFVVHAVILGLLTRNHVFLLGSPGTAKSMSARLILDSIQGAQVFRKQLTRQMTEEAVFGPLNFPKLREKGVYEYNLQGGLAECELALLEEYYDASDGCIRSMNELLNEREFSRNVGKVVKCPLQTAIATSNFWRDQKDAQAVADRFLIRVKVQPLQEHENMVDMIMGKKNPSVSKALTWKEIQDFQDEVRDVELPREVVEAFVEVYENYQKSLGEQVFISHRRLNWSAELIKAKAFLEGRKEAILEDILEARFGLVFIGEENQETVFMNAYENMLKERSKNTEVLKELKYFQDAVEVMEKEINNADQTRLLELHNEAVVYKEGLSDPNKPEHVNNERLKPEFDKLVGRFEAVIAEILKKVDASKTPDL